MKNAYSALIAVHDHEQPTYLRKALQSILDQTQLPKQVVIVKDGPYHSGMDDILIQFAVDCVSQQVELLMLYNQEPHGLAYSLNRGLAGCKQSLVARFDSDDISDKERMTKTLHEFNKHSDLSVVGSWIGEFAHVVDEISGIRKVPAEQAEIQKYARHRNPLNHMAVTFDKEAVIAVGGYTELTSFEDYYLWLRMLSKHMKFANIQEPLVWARVNDQFWDRRGGWNYFRCELIFQWLAYRNHYMSLPVTITNIISRGAIRLVPKPLLSVVYSRLRQ